jgi:hypoxanthine phosphoribosyltransferase
MADQRPQVLISEEAVQARITELAALIARDYAGVEDLLVVGVLRGAFIFMADLVRRLDPVQIDFIALSSYSDAVGPAAALPSGAVRLIMDVRQNIEGRHVLLVEDIIDSGYTMDYLLRTLSARRPASLRVCTLLRKPDRLKIDVPIDYVGFDIPDVWVVGCGLDLADFGRNFPYIGIVTPDQREDHRSPC